MITEEEHFFELVWNDQEKRYQPDLDVVLPGDHFAVPLRYTKLKKIFHHGIYLGFINGRHASMEMTGK
jgi:hypothetical protein